MKFFCVEGQRNGVDDKIEGKLKKFFKKQNMVFFYILVIREGKKLMMEERGGNCRRGI